jgi:phospholipase C
LWVNPSPGHSMHPGQGNIANGIEWLDNFVQAVKGSSAWANTAIIVIWDESGGWYDHVAPPQLNGTIGLGARVPVLVISPLAKTNYISSQQMDLVSVLRFIQWNWALGTFADSGQAAREAQSGSICDLLTTSCGNP